MKLSRALSFCFLAVALALGLSPAPTASAAGAPSGSPAAPSGSPVAPSGSPVAPSGSPVAPSGSPVAHSGSPVGPTRNLPTDEPASRATTAQADVAAALANLEYRSIGPANMGGRVSAVLGVPGDYKTFYVGGADGGIWKTTNGGTTFEGIFEDYEAYSIGDIAMAPSDHNVLWVGTGEGDPRNSTSYGLGVWRSTDAGRTFVHVGLPDTERIKRIVVDPRDPDTAFVCAMGHAWGPNEERGVFKTTDGGNSWDKVLYIDEDTGCSDITIDLSNPRNVYAGMWTFRRKPWHFRDGGGETALYKTTDGGMTWERKTAGLPEGPMARIGVQVAQSSPNVVYLITESPEEGTLFRSDDYGESWRMVNDERNINFRPFYYSDIRVDPTDPDTLYSLSGGLFKSIDGGKTFSRIANNVHGDHQSYWIDPEDGDHLLSGSDGGFQLSHDGGDNWDIIKTVVLSQFYQIFFDDRDPYYVCGGLQDNGNWCGPSRTNNPSGILMDDWYTVSGGDGFYAVPVPGKPNLIYSDSQGGYIYITDIHSGNVRSIHPYPAIVGSAGDSMEHHKYRFNWDPPIHISPHDPGTVYYGGNVLFKSTNYGHSWEEISPDLTTDDKAKQGDSGGEIYNDNTAAEFHCAIITIAEDRIEPGVIWTGSDDGLVHVTRDGGANWLNVTAMIPDLPGETWIAKIDASHHTAGTAYLAVDNHRMNDFTPHAYRCTDYGANCQDLSAGLPRNDYVKVIREDPKNPNVLYVGMERGLYASWDGGETWHDFRLNLPRVSVRDIKIHPRENDLIIGTHGRGAFILDDLTPIQNLTTAMNEDVYLFDVRRATRWTRWNQDASRGQRSWAGANPPAGAIISFYLKEAPGSATPADRSAPTPADRPSDSASSSRGASPVKIRITDFTGALVREITHREAKPGVNRAEWNLTHTGPRPLQSREETGGFFRRFFGSFGPPAVPGTYTATLIANGQEMSTRFEVRGDPRVEMSMADYRAQTDTAFKVRDLTSTVNELIDTVHDLNEQLDSLNGRLEDADVENLEQIVEQTGTALQQLRDLDNKLQRPVPRMGYRQYPRLSEELSSLNRRIIQALAPPTEGQLTRLAELDQETTERAAELNEIISTTIEELNQMLIDYPKIIVGSGGSGSDG